MAKLRKVHVVGENRLLAALPKKEYDRLHPHLERVTLLLRDILYEANGLIPHVYFPLGGVVSLVIIMDGGFSLEVGIIGNEGMVGTPVFLGCQSGLTRAISQVPGDALRMETQVFQKEMLGAGRVVRLGPADTHAGNDQPDFAVHRLQPSALCQETHVSLAVDEP